MPINTQTHTPKVTNIYTPRYISENFDADALRDYMDENGVEPLAKELLVDGTMGPVSSEQIGKIWGTMLDRLLANTDINLGMILRSYISEKSEPNRHQMIQAVIDVLIPHMQHTEVYRDALILGVAFLFDAIEDNTNASGNIILNTRVDYIDRRVNYIMDNPSNTSDREQVG